MGFFVIMETQTGFTCNTCGKVFETEEEFLNRHKKTTKKDSQNQTNENLKKE
jgi:hypothetical protein